MVEQRQDGKVEQQTTEQKKTDESFTFYFILCHGFFYRIKEGECQQPSSLYLEIEMIRGI